MTDEQAAKIKALIEKSYALRDALEGNKKLSREERASGWREVKRIVKEGVPEVMTREQYEKWMTELERRAKANAAGREDVLDVINGTQG